MTHSYIVELKYAKHEDPETRVEELRQEAIAQANRYADSETVKQAVGSTQLHKVVVVYKRMEMQLCEEICPQLHILFLLLHPHVQRISPQRPTLPLY